MIYLAIKTDQQQAELYLYDESAKLLDEVKWQAQRELAETIHAKITELLRRNNMKLKDINKILFYEGPGSFTGLRIGASVANALAYGLNIPAVQAGGEDWINQCLQETNSEHSVISPVYGSDTHITEQKK